MLKNSIVLFKIILFFIVSIILIASVFIFAGVTVFNLSYNNVNISELYIKYDKKLIVRANKINYFDKRANTKQNFDLNMSIKTYNNNLYIFIDKLKNIENNINFSAQIPLINNNMFSLNNLKIEEILLGFDDNKSSVYASSAYITKDSNTSELKLNNIMYENISISNFNIKYDKKLEIKSENIIFTDRNSFKEHRFSAYLDINKVQKNYLFDIKQFKYFTHDLSLKGKFELTDNDIKDFKNLQIKNFEVKDFSLTFDKFVKPVITKSTFITYENDNIYFDFHNPKVDDIELPKSSASVKNVTSDAYLELKLKSKDKITNKIIKIISYYGLTLPISKFEGENTIDVNINIPFYGNERINIDVDVEVLNANLIYNKMKIKAKKISVKYKNDILFIDSFNGLISTKDEKINYKNLNLIYKNHKFDIKSDIGNIVINDLKFKYDALTVVFDSNYNDINVYVNNASYKKNKKISTIFFNKVKINKKKNIFSVNSNVKYINSYLNINNTTNMDTNHSNGSINVANLNFKKLRIKNKTFAYKLHHEDNKIDFKIPAINFSYVSDKINNHEIKINNVSSLFNDLKLVDIISKNDKIRIITKDDFKSIKIFIDNLNANLNSNELKSNDNHVFAKLSIFIKNSNLAYDNRYIDINNAYVTLNKNTITSKIKAKNEKNMISFLSNENGYEINAKELSANFLNRILNNKKFDKGSFDFMLKGNNEKINGNVYIRKSTLKDVAVVSNLIRFINTTPAFINPILALPTIYKLGENNFDLNGYYIKKGNLNFKYDVKSEKLKIKNFRTKGSISDFTGDIAVDFKNKKINALVDVIFLKSYAQFISNIPLLGYILIGKDGNIVTKININGNFNEQTFETHLVNDSANAIFNVIKRTISLPLLPFKQNKEK